MKYIVYLFIILFPILGFSQNTLNQVINKFKIDNNSFLVYKNICQKYNSNESNDIYIKEYNLREPFPRLFDYETIEHFIENENNCNKKSYIKFISNPNNYIKDDRFEQYKKDYLLTYKINIISN